MLRLPLTQPDRGLSYRAQTSMPAEYGRTHFSSCNIQLAHMKLSTACEQGKLMEAIEFYHKALGLRSEDTISAQLLGEALRQQAGQDDLGLQF